jgi:hypothetical protein
LNICTIKKTKNGREKMIVSIFQSENQGGSTDLEDQEKKPRLGISFGEHNNLLGWVQFV